MAESPREAIVRTVLALERSCLDADAALTEHRWRDLEAAFTDQARLTRDLDELFARAPEASAARDGRVAQRIRGVLTYRDDQLRRLRAYHEEVGRRLRTISQMRELARTVGKRVAPAAFVDAHH